MRTELKVLRVKHKMTQAQFAEKIGVSRGMYALIEQGNRNGTQEVWQRLQTAFNVPDGEIWRLMKNDEE